MSAVTVGHSFRRRFLYKLAANLIGILLSFFQAGLVSRALGPRTYGDYNFLTNFFNQFVAFLEMRSSTFLYTSVSSKRTNTGVAAFYVYLALGVSVVAVLFPIVAVALGWQRAIWPGQESLVIILVAILALAFWYAEVLAKLCDALGVTVSLERIRVINAVIFFIVLAVMMRWQAVNLHSYLTFQFVTTLSLIAALALVLRGTKAFDGQALHPARLDMRTRLREVFAYSHPLFVYTLFGLGSNYADRWLLQKFGGSIQQGLFSLSLNIGLAFNVFINALHPLVMREFAVAFAANNIQRAAEVFRKLIPASYTLSAFFLCYAAVYADRCVRIIGGASYEGAAGVFAVMAFLPIIYNYSMLSGSVLYAANETRLLRNIGIVLLPLSIAATFFLIAPPQYGGLALGAIGLAVKMVGMELIGNNIVLFFNARLLRLRFSRYLFHQVFVAALLTGIAFVCRKASLLILGAEAAWLLEMFVGGVLYTAVCLTLFALIPSIAGIRKEEALAFLKEAVAKSQVAWARKPPEP
jgi:O-antigen/teichoic acid export membrane protein